MKQKNLLQKIFSLIKSLFLSGLFTILPIIVTIFIIAFTYDFLTRWFKPLRLLEPTYFRQIPGSEFILVTLFILLIGILLKLFIITPIVHWFENLIARIPFIRTIYSSSKILIDFFNIPDPSKATRKVVLIEFPRKGLYNIAFLLEEATSSFQKVLPKKEQETGKIYYKLFMPNSPNPTSGYFLIMPEDEIHPTDMSFEEAIKTVVSCGLITPESLKNISTN